jgi:hypothetical protein
MPDYTTMHRNRLSDATRITKQKLERGMVAKIRYKKVDGEARDYYVFVLQPNFKTYFHCLDLKHIAPPQMVKMASGLREVISQTPKVKKLDLTKLNLDVSSKQFYLNEIRNKKLKVGYRTLIEKNITSIMVYNYDYGIFDQIASEAERRQQAQVEKDDTPDFLQGI